MTLQWLFHNYQRGLLTALYEHPMEAVCLSELARRAGVDPGNTKRYLEKFAECGIVSAEKRGRKTAFRPNLGNPETRKIFELFELDRTKKFLAKIHPLADIRVDAFLTELVEQLPDIRLIVMYGLEDNDIVVRKPLGLAIVVGSLHDTSLVHHKVRSLIDSAGFRHEFELCVYTTDNLAAAWNKSDCGCVGFCNDRVVLFGEGYYWRLVDNQFHQDQTTPTDEEMVQNA